MSEISKIMESSVVHVKENTPIYDALQLLHDHDITGLPVVDGSTNLVGIITEKDALGLLSGDIDESATVEEYMTRDVVSFDVEDGLIPVCESLINNNFRRVPILSNGRLVGIVSRKDVIEYILAPIESEPLQ